MNPNMKPCPTCNKEIALSASTCPHCGETMGSAGRVALGLIAVLLLLAIVWFGMKFLGYA